MKPVVLLDQNTFAILGGIAIVLLALCGVVMLILKPFVDRAERKAKDAAEQFEVAKQEAADHLAHFRETLITATIDNAEIFIDKGAVEFIETCMPLMEGRMNLCNHDGIHPEEGMIISANFARPVFDIYANLTGQSENNQRSLVESMINHSILQIKLQNLNSLKLNNR